MVAGEARIRVGKEAPRLLSPEDTVEIPPGLGHIDPWNDSDAPTVTRNIISPVTPLVHVVFATLGEALAAGKLHSQDGLTFLQMAGALHEWHGDSWGEQPPIARRVYSQLDCSISRLLVIARPNSYPVH